MPGKRRILPRPCPICEKNYGTFQIVYFLPQGHSLQMTFRIGHYDPDGYRKAKQKSNNLEYQGKEGSIKLKRDLKNAQRKWCSFRSDHERKFNELHVIRYMQQRKKKTWTIRPHDSVLDKVKREGWKVWGYE